MAYVQQSVDPDKHEDAATLMEKAATTSERKEEELMNPQKNYEHPQDILKAIILNSTLGLSIQLLKHHVWLGSVVGAYPPTVKRGSSCRITSRGTPWGDPKGSKIAVVYAGSNVKDGPNNCAWLLAWHAPGDGASEPKVYVEAGDIHKYSDDQFNWHDVESNLEESSSKSYCIDDDTRTEASAQIIKNGNITKASAVFDAQVQSITSLTIN